MQINKITNLNFQAKKIAITRTGNNVQSPIELYKLSVNDLNYLEQVKKTINIAELMPNLEKSKASIWQDVFDYTMYGAYAHNITKYIAVCEKKLCGMMTTSKRGNNSHILGITAIPTERNKTVNRTGAALMCQAFRDAKNNGSKQIKLVARKDGPFDVVTKYQRNGFKIVDDGKQYCDMICPQEEIDKKLQKLIQVSEYKKHEIPDIIELDKVIQL